MQTEITELLLKVGIMPNKQDSNSFCMLLKRTLRNIVR